MKTFLFLCVLALVSSSSYASDDNDNEAGSKFRYTWKRLVGKTITRVGGGTRSNATPDNRPPVCMAGYTMTDIITYGFNPTDPAWMFHVHGMWEYTPQPHSPHQLVACAWEFECTRNVAPFDFYWDDLNQCCA